MDGRFVQNNFPLIGLPGIDICIVPRGISNEALTHLRETQEVALKEVDAVQPWLHHMKLEGTYYDPKSEILFSQTSSIGADGTKMAYNGAILFRDGKQVEIHANSLLSDKDSMAKLVAKIATGVSRAPK